MQEKLVIYLHAQKLDHPSWAVVDETGHVTESVYQGEFAALKAVAMDKTIVLLVPTEDVLFTTATLPKINRNRLLQALPFALEEQLIADVDASHFSLGEKVDDVWLVAVTAHEKMETWLSLMHTNEIQLDVLTPSIFALPVTPDAWQIYLADMALVRMGETQGFTSDLHNLNLMLDNALTTSTLPASIQLSNYTNTTYLPSAEWVVPVTERKLSPDQFVRDLAKHLDEHIAINLLQGRYAVKKAKRPSKSKNLRPLMGLAVVWVALLLLYPIVSYVVLKYKLSATTSEIATIYKHQFPEASSIVAPKLRMEEKWQKLTAEAGENRVLVLFGYIGKGMQASKGIKLNHADFQNNQLTLELTATTSEEMTAFTDYLNQQGLNVKQQNVNLAGAHINATLQVE
ncbi:MAG: type II secretion system protein GspL [Gammaproteobacteria bacterium]